ncbi:MAG: class I SAM-dependent methyltransferase [Gaiellaceae bacterium]
MEPTDHNRRAWDEVHRGRARSMRGELGIPDRVRVRLGDVSGQKVLHLQCASGDATAELARLGALVTGLDVSAEALADARELVPTALFVVGDVHALPPQIRRGRFDLVYSGDEGLTWVVDLEPWAAGIAASLRPGGRLVLHDTHPVVHCVDAALRWRGDYFAGEPATEPGLARAWRLGEILTALAGARLVLEFLEELPSTGTTRRQDPRVPAELLLGSRKPVEINASATSA